MGEKSEQDLMVERFWRAYLTTGDFVKERRQRKFLRWLPGDPRCKNCYAPFQGAGSIAARLVYGKQPSKLNPQLCNVCEQFARKFQGGAEIELSLLFADVRGSTNLAETMSALDFSKLINRFYNTATQVMVRSDALIDKIIGDQVSAMYVPGYAGQAHAQPRPTGRPGYSRSHRSLSSRRTVDTLRCGRAHRHRLRRLSRIGRRLIRHHGARRRGQYGCSFGFKRPAGRDPDQRCRLHRRRIGFG